MKYAFVSKMTNDWCDEATDVYFVIHARSIVIYLPLTVIIGNFVEGLHLVKACDSFV